MRKTHHTSTIVSVRGVFDDAPIITTTRSE